MKISNNVKKDIGNMIQILLQVSLTILVISYYNLRGLFGFLVAIVIGLVIFLIKGLIEVYVFHLYDED